MRTSPVYAVVPLALALSLTGCSGTNTAGFDSAITVSHPKGAYESEFQWGNNAHVHYLVHEVTLTEPGRADFELTVTVPRLGRMFGFVNLDVTCEVDGETSAADTDERLGEEHEGVFEFPMWCAVPESAEHLAVEIGHHDEHLRFEGPLD
ncbi:hypothetical protein [Nocardiopsis nanhaiensis]